MLLVTKVGYDVEGAQDWTADAVTGGIERALGLLRTDVLDVVLLHSCGREVLQRGEVIEALHAARDAGKVRVAGYSGENEDLDWAVRSGHFGAVETSVNLLDRWSLTHVLADAAAAGLGVIAKRPIANAPWRFARRPVGEYAEAYWERLQALGTAPADGDWLQAFVRFSAHAPGVSTAIVGTASAGHLGAAVDAVARGPCRPPSSSAGRPPTPRTPTAGAASSDS